MELILAVLTSKIDESYKLCQLRKQLPTERSRFLSSTGGLFPPWKVVPCSAQQLQAVTQQGMIIPNALCSAGDKSAALGNSKLCSLGGLTLYPLSCCLPAQRAEVSKPLGRVFWELL